MENIGCVNAHGDTVLRAVPKRIIIQHPNLQEEVTLDIFTGTPYTILSGMWKGQRVQVGDYVGQDGDYRSRRWLLKYPTQWKRAE